MAAAAAALDRYQQAIDLARQLGDRTGDWIPLGEMGNVDTLRHQYSEALDLYQQVSAGDRDTGRAGQAQPGFSLPV